MFRLGGALRMAMNEDRCPVGPDDQQWVDSTLGWCRTELGADPLRATVVVPNDEFFPDPTPTTTPQLGTLVATISRFVGVSPSRVTTGHLNDYTEEEVFPARVTDPDLEVPGHFRTAAGQIFFDADRLLAMAPVTMVASISHELCHARLPGELVDLSQDDEELVDLVAVYLGMGVFAANAAREYTKQRVGMYGLRMTSSRFGLLTEQMYGYALARYAVMRGEDNPGWARHLDTNPHTYFKRSMGYLRFVALD
jgi:hypothetical protein